MRNRWMCILFLTLLSGVLVPTFCAAKTETFTERKQRIMRKYLRENATITEGEAIVFELSEEEIALENERRRQDKADEAAYRSEGLSVQARMPPQPQPRKKKRAPLFDNSLTATTEEVAEESTLQSQPAWPSVNSRGDSSASYGLPARDSGSIWDRGTSVDNGAKEQKGYQPRNFGFGSRPDDEAQKSSYKTPASGYGSKKSESSASEMLRYGEVTPTESGSRALPKTQSYSPFRYGTSDSKEAGSPSYQPSYKRSTYTPSSYAPAYTSPTEQRNQQWDSRGQQQSQPSYQMKQQKSSTYNPASGESYADELMRKSKNR